MLHYELISNIPRQRLIKIIEVLIEKGADITKKDRIGNTFPDIITPSYLPLFKKEIQEKYIKEVYGNKTGYFEIVKCVI